VIVGAGFGGLSCARKLAPEQIDVVLIDRNDYTLFQPMLYQVATGAVPSAVIADPVADALDGIDVRFVQTEVRGVDLGARSLDTSAGPVAYDYLVLATGSVPNFFGNEDVHRASFPLKGLQDALRLRTHLVEVLDAADKATDPGRRDELLTILVVGGGPIGVECAGAIANLADEVIPKLYTNLKAADIKVHLYEGSDAVMGMYPQTLSSYATERLSKLGVQVHTGHVVADASETGVVLKDGTHVAGHTLVWGTGTVAAPLAGAVDTPKGRHGLIEVNDDFSLPGHPEVFAIGDVASYEWQGSPLPGLAQPAIQGGRHVADVIVINRMGKLDPDPFSYWDKGSMAVIGRGHAIASIPMPQPFHADKHPGGPKRTLNLKGFPAWSSWLGLHLSYLRGWTNKAITALDWSYDYILDDRKSLSEAITDSEAHAAEG
jgi:NADH dehydrogenase